MDYRIKELCREKNINVGELAEKIGIARESLSRIINGNNTSTETLSKIAETLNVPITDLFARPGSSELICPNCGAKLELKIKE